MGDRNVDELRARAVRQLGPAAHRFAEWAQGELWDRSTRAALDYGLTPIEANQVAMMAVAGAVKGLVGGIQQMRLEREYRRQQ